jgi:hypothetical protein
MPALQILMNFREAFSRQTRVSNNDAQDYALLNATALFPAQTQILPETHASNFDFILKPLSTH